MDQTLTTQGIYVARNGAWPHVGGAAGRGNCSHPAIMFTAPLFKLIEEAGEGVLLLLEDLQEAEFLRSRLTRLEVLRQLHTMADTLGALPPEVRTAMPELEWDGWRSAAAAMAAEGAQRDETAWFAARSLVPATLSWLRVYRDAEPAMFEYRA